jgi:indolepyruvate ferredoxin oxidoreductase beta subunit
MGGQGGGVLVDWIVALAEGQDWLAQATSVPGVAQRTGATLYYVEMLPKRGERRPVLSLMPVPGEVDVVLGAELMEAGRAILRGLVAPDRTTLIASTHRAYAVQEKAAPGDGRGDSGAVHTAAEMAARRFIAFDMAREAEAAGSVISAVMFGALAAAQALPFGRAAFEQTVRSAGIGVEASLRAFARGFEAVASPPPSVMAPDPGPAVQLHPVGNAAFDVLIERARALPAEVHEIVGHGLRRVVDFQDVDYGAEYLGLVESMLAVDRAAKGHALTRAAARHIAVAMAYDDVIRIADRKTRAARFARVRDQMGVAPSQIVMTTEFMHPRMEEFAGTLPRALGSWIEARPRLFRMLDRVVNRGRRVRTDTVFGFGVLHAVACLRRFRRGTLRHTREVAHRDAWLARVLDAAATDHALAVELVEARRLIKGYSDTHARGQAKFDRVMAAAARLQGRPDCARRRCATKTARRWGKPWRPSTASCVSMARGEG